MKKYFSELVFLASLRQLGQMSEFLYLCSPASIQPINFKRSRTTNFEVLDQMRDIIFMNWFKSLLTVFWSLLKWLVGQSIGRWFKSFSRCYGVLSLCIHKIIVFFTYRGKNKWTAMAIHKCWGKIKVNNWFVYLNFVYFTFCSVLRNKW